MPRVLLFTTDLELGGTPTVVRELARRLRGDDFETAVVCLGRAGPVADLIQNDGVGVTALDLSPRRLPTAVRSLRRIVRDGGVDTVLSFLLHANAVAALARRRGDGVRWWQSIQTTQPDPAWHWHVQRLAAKRAHGIIVPSFGVADVAARRSGIEAGLLRVVPNAIDPASLAETPRPPRDPKSPLRAVFLGRLDPVKRVPMLAEAVSRLDRVTLDIYGDGPDRAAIEPLAGDAVRLHGFANRDDALADADVLVLPSAAEGFGLVLIEAMAALQDVGERFTWPTVIDRYRELLA